MGRVFILLRECSLGSVVIKVYSSKDKATDMLERYSDVDMSSIYRLVEIDVEV